MKIFAYISLVSAACFFALFFSVPLTGYVIAYIVFLFCLLEVFAGLHLLYSANKEDKEVSKKIIISQDEMDLITHIKTNNLDLLKLIQTGMTIRAVATKDGEYSVILVPSHRTDVLDKIKTVITESEGT